MAFPGSKILGRQAQDLRLGNINIGTASTHPYKATQDASAMIESATVLCGVIRCTLESGI